MTLIILVCTYKMCLCLFVCLYVPPSCGGHKGPKTELKAPKLCQSPKNWDEGPKTGLKAPFGGLWSFLLIRFKCLVGHQNVQFNILDRTKHFNRINRNSQSLDRLFLLLGHLRHSKTSSWKIWDPGGFDQSCKSTLIIHRFWTNRPRETYFTNLEMADQL